MQFAGQHPGGLNVPTVGMAFPGYVAQPHLGGNSEMTWYSDSYPVGKFFLRISSCFLLEMKVMFWSVL